MTFEIIKRNVIGFILALILMGGWAKANYKLSLDIVNKRAEFEKYKSEETYKLKERELQISTTISQINIVIMDLKKKAIEADSKMVDALNKESIAIDALNKYQPYIVQKQEDEEIKTLIKQFSELKVDLNIQPSCSDIDWVNRYNQAKIVISDIAGRVHSAGLDAKYSSFLRSNYPTTYQGCR